jgi:outer membrane protein assembly factor BamB
LVARDAFNGKTLWKRKLESWITHLRYFRSGPVQLPRRLVSVGNRVYVTLGLDAPVSVLDAATGETRQVFESTGHVEEFICMDDKLLVVIGDPQQWNRYAPKADNYWDFYAEGEPPVDKTILAIDRETGQLRWEVEGEHLRQLVPLSLVADGDRVFYLDNAALHCLDLATARELWAAPFATKGQFLRNYAPTVVVHKDTIICQSLDRLAVMSIGNGETLWEKKGYAGFASPGDVFVIDDTVWTFPHTATVHLDRMDVPGEGQRFLGFDLYTGQVKKSFDKNDVWPGGHHHRCYRNKATEQFVICGRRGVEFVDLEGENHVKNWWIRGVCQYGILPCNGLLYVPPHPCRCFSQYKFDGFHALASTNSLDHDQTPPSDRLRTGPAFGTLTRPGSEIAAASAGAEGMGRMWHAPLRNAKPEDWPTHRCDISRSGSTPSPVPAELGEAWKTHVGGSLSSPVISDGRVLVSSVDRHTVHCLDAASGRTLWTFIAGGRVDSPPTIFEQMAVFGCRDGSVYAVAVATGQLVWRFRAAPVDYRIIARNRLESVWPVHGSVLVAGGVVYFAAGHSSHVDGGIRLYGLDIWTGEILHESAITSEAASQAGALPDVLVSGGGTINMRHVQFDMSLQPQSRPRLNTLMTTTGMLEDLWAHRLNWALGSSAQPKSFDASVPFGKLVVFDGETAYGVQSFYTVLKHTKSMWPDTHTGHLHQKYARYTPDRFPIGNRLYAMDNGPPVQRPTKKQRRTRSDGPTANRPNRPRWSRNLPLQVRAMVLADDHLFIAGWEDAVGVSPAEFGAATGPQEKRNWLWTIAAGDGDRLGQIPLPAEPFFDGMAAAAGRLFVSLQDGSLVCLGRR